VKRIAVVAAVIAMGWFGAAFASSCPTDMKEIDEALAKGTKLSPANLEKVKKFRAEGEKLHKAGKHKESIDTLEKAKVILGI